jgi:acyl-CoA thioesterase FadM
MMAEMVETYRGTVYPWHCDHMDHMNVMWYVGKFDEGTWNFFSMLGVTPSYLRDNGRGMAAVDQRIAYRRELHAGDTVAVRTGTIEVKEKDGALRARDAQRRDRRGLRHHAAHRRLHRHRGAQGLRLPGCTSASAWKSSESTTTFPGKTRSKE